MKITRLQSSNIMRLVAVDITPEGNLITIGGKNGAGKSAVLNSVAMALGGMALVPQEPIRAGETEASVTVNLDDGIIIIRKFYRDRLCDCGVEGEINDLARHASDCIAQQNKFGDTKSNLIVKNKEGFTAPTPQALLDKLLVKLTFDPLAFKDDPKKDILLRQLVNLDVRDLEKIRADAFVLRASQKKTLEVREAQLIALPKHEGVPAEEISIEEITTEMQRAEQHIKTAEAADRAIAETEATIRQTHEVCNRHQLFMEELQTRIEDLQSQINSKREKLIKDEAKLEAEQNHAIGLRAAAEAARQAVPDMAAIRQRLTETTATNEKIRANQRYEIALGQIVSLQDSVREFSEMIGKADDDKRARLNAVQFPVPGLGLSDQYGVMFNQLPFDQASTADQLRVSVAIGLALNPKLKVLLIRSGNLLDEDSMKLVAAQAAEAEAQVWMEYVTSDAKDVQVMIVDGRVAESEILPAL